MYSDTNGLGMMQMANGAAAATEAKAALLQEKAAVQAQLVEAQGSITAMTAQVWSRLLPSRQLLLRLTHCL
jgi:hypothetical protein